MCGVLRVLLVFAVGLYAHSVVACPNGVFAVEGWNPGVMTSAPSYTGEAVIKTAGGVCQMEWRIGRQHFQGVGLYDEAHKQLSIAYADQEEGWFGVVVYEIDPATLTGRWTVYGDVDGKVGKENLHRKDDR